MMRMMPRSRQALAWVRERGGEGNEVKKEMDSACVGDGLQDTTLPSPPPPSSHDPPHDDLVGHHPLRHGRQHAARLGDVVVGAVERVARVGDGLALPRQVAEDGDAQLLG
jgi:hypothetical protein